MGQKYVGPCEIECPLKCDVPTGFTMIELEVFGSDVRHDWGDVVRCPNDPEDILQHGGGPNQVCGRVFLQKVEE